MRNHVIRARVDERTKKAIVEMAQQSSLTESDLIRNLVARGLSATLPSDFRLEWAPDHQRLKRKKISVRLPKFLVDLATERASLKGMPLSTWIGSLVQSHVFQPPVVTEDELRVINESNRQLRSLGTNINQIARAFNRNEIDIRWLSAFGGLESRIDENRQLIRSLIQAVNRSWRVIDGDH